MASNKNEMTRTASLIDDAINGLTSQTSANRNKAQTPKDLLVNSFEDFYWKTVKPQVEEINGIFENRYPGILKLVCFDNFLLQQNFTPDFLTLQFFLKNSTVNFNPLVDPYLIVELDLISKKIKFETYDTLSPSLEQIIEQNVDGRNPEIDTNIFSSNLVNFVVSRLKAISNL
ncbi:MAG: hypothetical protein QM530_04530 [Phycisphaerales bacterium]|nr:hypothetical protein [Phycisphaerales bacterium]